MCLTHYPHDEQKLKWIFGHRILIGAQNIDILGYRLTVLRPRGQADKAVYAGIISSPFPYPITLQGGGGGLPQKGGGILRYVNSKPYIDVTKSTRYLIYFAQYNHFWLFEDISFQKT